MADEVEKLRAKVAYLERKVNGQEGIIHYLESQLLEATNNLAVANEALANQKEASQTFQQGFHVEKQNMKSNIKDLKKDIEEKDEEVKKYKSQQSAPVGRSQDDNGQGKKKVQFKDPALDEEAKKAVAQKHPTEALWDAVDGERLEDIKAALMSGAEIDSKRTKWPDGTPLMAASYLGNIDVVRYLIEQGANVNIQNKNGETALMYALYRSNLDIVDILVDAGANKRLKNKNGEEAKDVIDEMMSCTDVERNQLETLLA